MYRRAAARLRSMPTEALILVPGELPHLPRRLLDWLKTAARADLTAGVAQAMRP